jgi:hypothetical protein
LATSSINLMPARRRDALRRRRRIQAWIATVCVYACVVGAGALWSFVATLDFGSREQLELADLSARAKVLEEDTQAKQAEFASANATLKANLVVHQEPNWSVLMALIAAELREDAVLERFRMMQGEYKGGATDAPAYVVLLTGTSLSQANVFEFTLRLEGLKLFRKVTIVESRRKSIGGREVVGFDMRCELDAEVAP